MFQDTQMVCIELYRHWANDSLVARVQNAEIATQLFDWIDSFSQVIHCHLLCVSIGTHLLQESKALRLLEETSILFTESDANVYDLDLDKKREWLAL